MSVRSRPLSEDKLRSRVGPAGRRLGGWLPPLVTFAVVGLAWIVIADNARYLLPHPGETLAQLVDHPSVYVDGGRGTLAEALIGLVIGYGGAAALAVVMSQVSLVERAVLPLAVVLNVTPVVAIAPSLVVAFGFGSSPKIILTAVIVFFPALINVLIGLRAADPQVLDVLRSLDASPWELLRHVRLPSALPYAFAAARVCVPLSLVGAVVAEFVAPGGSTGLGALISNASASSQLPVVYAAVICLAVIGIALSLIVIIAERRALAWQPGRRGEQGR